MAQALSRYLSLTGITLILSYLWSATLASTNGGPIHVKSGQSIQAAINAAQSGARIIVEAGTYHEQLTITSNGINLIGRGAVLVPPSIPVNNTCSGLAGPDTEAGICVTGLNVELAPFDVEHRRFISVVQPVKDVLIAGFEVRNFGSNVAVVGGKDIQILNNHLANGDAYGCLILGSSDSKVESNTVMSTDALRFIAICNDASPGIHISTNHVSGYVVGLCIQTPDADIQHNDVVNSCIGAFVDPNIDGAKIRNNHISNANTTCALVGDGTIDGVLIYGASNTLVEQNVIETLSAGGVPGKYGIGITIADFTTGSSVTLASDNHVAGNTLRNNDLDIFISSNGTGNVVEGNQCSTPAELCTRV